jgi:uncharacterized cupin superfamily protein
MPNRPPFIISSSDVPERIHRYPNSQEGMAPVRPIGRAAGMLQIGINDGDRDALLLSGGEADKASNRIYYPLDPGRRNDMPWRRWWDDVPLRPRGAHDGKARRR